MTDITSNVDHNRVTYPQHSRSVAALFETPAEAEKAVAALAAAGFSRDQIEVTQNTETAAGTAKPAHEHGFWHSITSMFDNEDDDAHVYGEGVRRGGSLVTVHTDEVRADDAIDVLDRHDPVDLDIREREWRAAGWAGRGTAPTQGAVIADRPVMADRPVGTLDREEVIPVVEEELVVGKREVGRGNVRVRSFVRDIPVSEQVSLREENVHVERRSVNRPVEEADATAFRDRTIEMTEVNEEAVVGKTARVTEEVVVRKDVADRTETISDTVRKTEVEVDDDRHATDERRMGTNR